MWSLGKREVCAVVRQLGVKPSPEIPMGRGEAGWHSNSRFSGFSEVHKRNFGFLSKVLFLLLESMPCTLGTAVKTPLETPTSLKPGCESLLCF